MKRLLRIESIGKLPESERFCTCCKRRLITRFAWLELSMQDGKYYDIGIVQDKDSQGLFQFGLSCAHKLLADLAREETDEN